MAGVVGVPKEIKDQEGRVSMQPDGVFELVHHDHEVVVESGAGEGSGFSDEEYERAGARIVDGPEEVFESSDLIVKVKEPVPEEYDRFREGQELFTYLHLAADKRLTGFLMERKINSIAYETVELPDGSLPLLTPMSEVAGRMATQAAAHCLESPQGGAEAPKLVSREMVASMKDGSVVVDVAIDQGGCIETARPTTHSDPTYVEEGVIHYCVANIPGAVARTSTLALTSVTLPYLLRIADEGLEGAATADPALAKGLSTLDGNLVSEPVAEAHDLPHTDPEKLLR